MNDSIPLSEKQPSEVLVQDLRNPHSVSNEKMFDYDKQLFMTHYCAKAQPSEESMQLRTRLTYYVHKLEKGLSHSKFRYGFGKEVLALLAETMRAYRNLGFELSDKSYVNALSVTKSYLGVHEAANYDVAYVGGIFGDLLESVQECSESLGGAMTVQASKKLHNRSKNFKELFNERCSVRDYADTPVNRRLVEEAIEIAMKTPSVCNRQTARVYVMTDPDVIRRVSEIQISLSSYDMPPLLLAVVSDTRGFLNMTERREPYIDGGLFAMSLMLAMEYVGLATCPFNAMFTLEQERAFRKLVNIEPSETLITFIAVGNFPDSCRVPKSFRYSGEEVTTFV